ncbi:MAG TPA: rhodanese-like domain-containing protein [Anaerolineae bacterium]|nr:rhodanese-like domain-containing protein [Anaerolineae bacterium]
MTDSKTGSTPVGWAAPLLLLAVVAAAVFLISTASPAAESTSAAASPTVAVQYRMAQVKTPTSPATVATRSTATDVPQATATRAPAPTPTLVPTLPAPPTSAVVASLNAVARIAPDAARAQVEAGTAVLVDVRTEASYKQGHLPGAILLPGGVSNSGYRELPGDRLLIFYCA